MCQWRFSSRCHLENERLWPWIHEAAPLPRKRHLERLSRISTPEDHNALGGRSRLQPLPRLGDAVVEGVCLPRSVGALDYLCFVEIEASVLDPVVAGSDISPGVPHAELQLYERHREPLAAAGLANRDGLLRRVHSVDSINSLHVLGLNLDR